METIKNILLYMWELIKKGLDWLLGNVHTSLEIAVVLTITTILFNLAVLSKLWIIALVAILAILIYNIVQK